jgi:hypothetical protein
VFLRGLAERSLVFAGRFFYPVRVVSHENSSF